MRNIVLCGLMMMVIVCAGCSSGSGEVFAFGNGTVEEMPSDVRCALPDSVRYAALPDDVKYAVPHDSVRYSALPNDERYSVLPDNERYSVLPDNERYAALPDNERYAALPDREDNKMLSARHAFPSSNPTRPPSKTLNSGHSIPVLGLGTWTLNNSAAEEATYSAILSGYRLFDTAHYYSNEAGIGRAVRKAISEGIISREDVFITSKIVPSGNQDYDSIINESNNTLGLEYIDLMLIHQSGYGDEQLYQALERAAKSGIVRSIGISNYYTPEEYERITANAEIPPAVVQNENHPYYQNSQLQNYLQRYGVVIESWYPLGGRGHTQELFSDKVIARIAKNHSKSPAQVIIRWHIQAGYIVIPGSKNPKHIRENIDVFDFELTDDEMKAIQKLNKNRRFENW